MTLPRSSRVTLSQKDAVSIRFPSHNAFSFCASTDLFHGPFRQRRVGVYRLPPQLVWVSFHRRAGEWSCELQDCSAALSVLPLVCGLTASLGRTAEVASMVESFLEAGMPDEILFAVRKPSTDGHWYANIGYYAADQCQTTFPMNSGGKLCVYNIRTKEVRTIFEDPSGNIRDPQIHYDAQKLVFAYLPKEKRHYSLFEINIDGTGLRQLTGQGEDVSPGMEDYQRYSPPGWDDYEPAYLPDDQIIFCSTRANRYVQCWMTQVGTLYKCNSDGATSALFRPMLSRTTRPGCSRMGRSRTCGGNTWTAITWAITIFGR